MTTIYTRLSPLGFAEWLAVKVLECKPDFFKEGVESANNHCERIDSLDVDDKERTSLNALAFRWLREEKGIDCYPFRGFYDESDFFYATVYIDNKKISDEKYDTHPLAEIAALKKAAEIIEQDNNEN
jgi:hypothetical protein